jgi:hypothetical protein
MPDTPFNKFRAALEVLQNGRDILVDSLADEILDQSYDLMEGSYQFNELLETQGTRLHFLSLLVAQLEQSAEAFDEAHPAPPPPTPPADDAAKRRRRPRTKKLPQQASTESTSEET